MRLATAILLLCVLSAWGEIIPADRRMDWQVDSNVGVVGGIPNRTTIFTNVVTAGADNTGVSDASAIIQTCIDYCPSNQVVYIPAGIYLIQTSLQIQGRWDKGVTLRGDGTNTILKGELLSGASMIVMGYDWDGTEISAADFSKGSSNLVVDDGSGVIVGGMVLAGQRKNEPYVRSTHVFDGLQRYVGFVRSKSGNNLSVWPPSFWNFTNLYVVPTANDTLYSSSVENLRLMGNSPSTANGIELNKAANCWVTGVRIDGMQTRHMFIYHTANCTIRSNYLYGFTDEVGMHAYANNTGLLIEDNVFDKASMVLMGSTSGSVVSYNYFNGFEAAGFPHQSGVFNVNHEAQNLMNLYEGNVAEQFQSDGLYGSSSHCTIFRNWWNMQHPIYNDNRKAIDLCRWSYYFNSVGNVLGYPGMTGFYEMYTLNYDFSSNVIYRLGYPSMAGNSFYGTNFPGVGLTNYPLPLPLFDGYAFVTNTVTASTNSTLLIGNFTNVSAGDEIYFSTPDLAMYYGLTIAASNGTTTNLYVNSPVSVTNGHLCFVRNYDRWQQLDLNVSNTFLKTLDFDYVNNAKITNADIADTTLPDSFYLSSKPAWFLSAPWPPISPDGPTTNYIPAQSRFLGLDYSGSTDPLAGWNHAAKLRIAASSSPPPPDDGNMIGTGDEFGAVNAWQVLKNDLSSVRGEFSASVVGAGGGTLYNCWRSAYTNMGTIPITYRFQIVSGGWLNFSLCTNVTSGAGPFNFVYQYTGNAQPTNFWYTNTATVGITNIAIVLSAQIGSSGNTLSVSNMYISTP